MRADDHTGMKVAGNWIEKIGPASQSHSSSSGDQHIKQAAKDCICPKLQGEAAGEGASIRQREVLSLLTAGVIT